VIVVCAIGVVVLVLASWYAAFRVTLSRITWYGGASTWSVRRNQKRMRADLRSALGRQP